MEEEISGKKKKKKKKKVEFLGIKSNYRVDGHESDVWVPLQLFRNPIYMYINK